MLAGLEKPTKGEIIIAGKHMERMNENQLVQFRRENVGFIFQSFNLLGTMDAVENVALPLLYGNVKKTLTMPLHSVFFVLTNEMDTYCNVTQIDKDLIKADLVMHNPKQNIIHLFVVSIPTSELFKNGGNIKAELYANIPQNDIKNIYSKKRK